MHIGQTYSAKYLSLTLYAAFPGRMREEVERGGENVFNGLEPVDYMP